MIISYNSFCPPQWEFRFGRVNKKSRNDMALWIPFMCLIATAFPRNGQAIVAKSSVGDPDVSFALELGEQPWLALLAIPDGVFCSGTIVSPTSILSAALCLQGVQNPTHGTAYAGNIKYIKARDFDPPTQNRSIVEYHFYDPNNSQVYNFMLVKIDPKWTWSGSVQPIGIIEDERLPESFASTCFMSGLGDRLSTGECKVAHSACVWMDTWRSCVPSPQEHLMCFDSSGILVPQAGDLGGPILCDYEPEDKLYGIISEHGPSSLEELLEGPSQVNGFQFVGFYMPWIKETAGDLLSDEEVKAIRQQHKDNFLRVLGPNGLFPVAGRKKRAMREGAAATGGGVVEATTASPAPCVLGPEVSALLAAAAALRALC